MFRKEDFKKVDLLGSGKKNTKIYKVIHRHSGKYYALKEVEAKSLDKLNEYKEEAVQLFKAQNHPNVIQFYGYFFYETMYNTFRIGIVCEYIEHKSNLEYVFRKRKQMGLFWKQNEMERMIMSLVSTLAHMQSVGLCHRDLKPANLFLLPNGHIKVIDFGESKDLFKLEEDGGNATTATIRGTPQYLSPILWKAHVVDGNSRFAKHNIYKSDVFSVGLLFYQLAVMEDVTGFNQKSSEYDGEKLVAAGINKLRETFSENVCHILNLTLKFYEKDRPSFIELHRIMLSYPEFAQHDVAPCLPNQGNQEQNPAALQVQSRPYINRANSPGDPASLSNLNTSNINLYNQAVGSVGSAGGPGSTSGPVVGSQNSRGITQSGVIPQGPQPGRQPTSGITQNGPDGAANNTQLSAAGGQGQIAQFGQSTSPNNTGKAAGLLAGGSTDMQNPSYGPVGAKNNQNNFIGVPPHLTESSHKTGDGGEFVDEEEEEEAQNNIMTQAELFKSYAEQNSLYVNQFLNVFWFEYGGRAIAKMNLDIIWINQQKMKANHQNESDLSDPEAVQAAKNGNPYIWKPVGKYRDEFSPHQAVVYNVDNESIHILGANGNKHSNLMYDHKTVKVMASMPSEKTFFATVYYEQIIYTFGGYDAYDKCQLSSCEYYDVVKDEWFNSELVSPNGKIEYKLKKERSQASACLFGTDQIFVFGGYSKEEGTLDTIERFNIRTKTIELLTLRIPSPLRRFQSMKISTKKILLIGGISTMGKLMDSVFCFDLEKEYTIEQLDKIDRAGCIDYPIILDQVGNLHLFLERSQGTIPPQHVIYSFLEYS